jgi:hypothetical protein
MTNELVPPALDPPVSSGFYKQVVGVAAPLGANTIVVVTDVFTGLPLEMPVNIIIMNVFWSALVPLTSANNAQATSQMVLIEDLNNLTGNIYLGDYNLIEDVNATLSTENLAPYAFGQAVYRYVGVECSKNLPLYPITGGTLKLVIQ